MERDETGLSAVANAGPHETNGSGLSKYADWSRERLVARLAHIDRMSLDRWHRWNRKRKAQHRVA